MRERFTVDQLVYEVRVDACNEITFAIVGGANSAYQSWTYDPLDSVDDWDIEPNITEDIGVTRYPLRVYREVLERVMSWIGGMRPHAFSFTLQSDRRRWIYERTARYLAKRFDYDLQVTGQTYHFYKLKNLTRRRHDIKDTLG